MPGYSALGAAAGRSSVLAFGSRPWRRPRLNPWETAPIHLAQLLAPSLAGGHADRQRPVRLRTGEGLLAHSWRFSTR